jgi:hypothetical protein
MIDKACDESPTLGDSWALSSGETLAGYTTTIRWMKDEDEDNCSYSRHDVLDPFLESNCKHCFLPSVELS